MKQNKQTPIFNTAQCRYANISVFPLNNLTPANVPIVTLCTHVNSLPVRLQGPISSCMSKPSIKELTWNCAYSLNAIFPFSKTCSDLD